VVHQRQRQRRQQQQQRRSLPTACMSSASAALPTRAFRCCAVTSSLCSLTIVSSVWHTHYAYCIPSTAVPSFSFSQRTHIAHRHRAGLPASWAEAGLTCYVRSAVLCTIRSCTHPRRAQRYRWLCRARSPRRCHGRIPAYICCCLRLRTERFRRDSQAGEVFLSWIASSHSGVAAQDDSAYP
jgi:hypothetical protein